MNKNVPHPLFKLATELGPLVVFFVANAKGNLFIATGAFMVAFVVAMAASYIVTRHVPLMTIVSGIIVLVFGSLTLVFHDEAFIKINGKPHYLWRAVDEDTAHSGVDPRWMGCDGAVC